MTDETLTPPPNASFHLASRNTSLAFQRTRMAADRTLMAVIRTALSLISFGFTIYKLAQTLIEDNILKATEKSAHHYGVALVLLGIIMLGFGILYHIQFMLALRHQRQEMIEEALIRRHGRGFPLSFTLVTAVILLLLGLAVILSMVFHLGPLE
jgi:putative membrane protein